jgi:NADH:ubiquinone oxidoreductase subunit D
MNEMSESLNIINQVIYKLIKLNKIKKKKDKSIIISPHSILKYTYLKS